MKRFLQFLRTVEVTVEAINSWTNPDDSGTFALFDLGGSFEGWKNDPSRFPRNFARLTIGGAAFNFFLTVSFTWDPS